MIADLETRLERAMRPRKHKPTAAQLAVLRIIDEMGSDSWGDAWTHSEMNWGENIALKFRNFDRVCKALVAHCLVVDDSMGIALTDAGRRALKETP